MDLKRALKQAWFRLLGLEPEAAVVSFATGPDELVIPMVSEVMRLLPARRHFLVSTSGLRVEGAEPVVVGRHPWLEVRRALRGLRIGMAPVLFEGDPAWAALRGAAFCLAPGKVLAYNSRLERHHLQVRCCLASLLFLCRVPLDRIWLRPKWWPSRHESSTAEDRFEVREGRPESTLRAKVAVLSPYVPYPLSHGGAVRIGSLLREASASHDITLFAFVENETADDFLPVLDFCARLVLVKKPRYREPRWSTLLPPEAHEYDSPAMRRALADVMSKHGIHLLQAEYTQLGRYGGQILVEHDITFDLYRQVLASRGTLAAWWDWWRWQRFEKRLLPRFPCAVVMSEKDAILSGHPRAEVIANGVGLERFTPTQEPDARRLLFIGSFRHFPNVLAFQHLIRDIWPLVDDADLTVVAGPDPLPHWRALSGQISIPAVPRARVLQYVADVKPLYDETNVVIVPTLVSAGTNIKVLEAMAAGRAVVSTPSGCAGLGLRHGESVLIGRTAEELAAHVRLLLNRPGLRRRLADNARSHAVEHFSWRALGRKQTSLWSRFIQDPVLIRPMTHADLDAVARIQSGAAQWPATDYLLYQALVAQAEGRVIGFIVTRRVAGGEHELLNLAVSEPFRRQGVAQRLYFEAIEHIEGQMFLEVRESNLAARALYERLGFQAAGVRPGYYENPAEPAIVMRARIC
jgi:ribosomal-protein-alanine acetyltransferase